jgi:sugar (pentulose or hexulose) kinase
MFSVYKIASLVPPARNAAAYRCLTDFLLQSWEMEPVIDWGCAARTGAFDVTTKEWSAEVLGVLAQDYPWLKADRLSRPVPCGQAIGAPSLKAQRILGLGPEALIVAGTHDQCASFIGVGSCPVVSFGSSDCVTVGAAQPFDSRPDHGRYLARYPARAGLWIALAGTAGGGWSLEWYASLFGEAVTIPGLLAEMPASPPEPLMLPYLAGANTFDNDPLARGAWLGLSLGTSRAELTRAVVEAAGYELGRTVDAFRDMGVAIDSLVATGAGANDRSVLQIRADAAGIALRPCGGDAAIRGAAMLAAEAAGLELAPAPGEEPVTPRSEWSQWHGDRRRLYSTAAPQVRAFTGALHQAGGSKKGNPQ